MRFQRQVKRAEGSILFNIRTGELQVSNYKLYTRRGEQGDDWGGGRAAYSTRAKLQMRKDLQRWKWGRVSLGIRKSKHK